MNLTRFLSQLEGTASIVWMELLRTSRRGVPWYVRLGVGLALLMTFSVLFASSFGFSGLLNSTTNYDHRLLAKFGERLTSLVLIGLYIVVLALTPALVVGTITEDLRRNTLEMLCTTPLSSVAILLGKLLGRIVQVGSIVLLLVPILSLMQLLGGASGPIMLASLSMTLLASLSLAAYSLWSAVSQPTLSKTLQRSYGLPAVMCWLGFILIFFPESALPAYVMFNLPWLIGNRPGLGFTGTFETVTDWFVWLGAGVLLHGTALVYSIARATARLRQRSQLQHSRPSLSASSALGSTPPRPQALDAPTVIVAPRLRAFPPIRDDTDVLWWKEFYYESDLSTLDEHGPKYRRIDLPIVPLLYSLLTASCCLVSTWTILPIVWAMILSLATMVFGILSLLRTSNSITGERARKMLDALLMLPVERRELLTAKYRASLDLLVRQYSWLLLVVASVWVIGLVFGSLRSLSALILPGVCAVHVGFFAALGLWSSVRSATTSRALVLAGVVLLLTQLPPTLLCVLTWPQVANVGMPSPAPLTAAIVSMPAGWLMGAIAISYPLTALVVLLGNAVFFLLASWVLFQDACRVFERQDADSYAR